MIYDEEARKNGWVISETDPGYATKTLRHNNCTIIINRPILSPAEQKKREEKVSQDVSRALRDYIWKKEKEGKDVGISGNSSCV